MAETIHYTRYELNRPWLIDDSGLKRLDEAIVDAADILRRAEVEALRIAADDHVAEIEDSEHRAESRDVHLSRLRQIHSPGVVPVVEFALSDKRIIRGGSLSELQRQSDVAAYPTIAISIEMHAFRSCSLTFLFDLSEGNLTIRGTPAENPKVTEAFNTLRKWAVDHQPPQWLEIWKEWSPVAAIAAGLVFAFQLALFFTKTGGGHLTAAAKKLIDHGIDATNMPQAVDLLLRAQFDLPAIDATTSPEFPTWTAVFFAVTLVLFVGRPRPAVGIGPTLNAPANRRLWIKIASWSIPIWLLTNILVPVILDRLKH